MRFAEAPIVFSSDVLHRKQAAREAQAAVQALRDAVRWRLRMTLRTMRCWRAARQCGTIADREHVTSLVHHLLFNKCLRDVDVL